MPQEVMSILLLVFLTFCFLMDSQSRLMQHKTS